MAFTGGKKQAVGIIQFFIRSNLFHSASGFPVSIKLVISVIIIVVFHLIGLIGMLGDHPSFFIRNTPVNLLLSAVLLIINQNRWNMRQIMCLIFIFFAGFFLEVFGTNTGYLFGNYHYGKTLGLQLFNVPVVIGINWLMVVYMAGNLVERLESSWVIKAVVGSVILVVLDYFIEPVAMHFDYWQWENGIVPETNYLCWFIISFLFLSLFSKIGFKDYNPMAGLLLFLQLFMFIALNRVTN